MSMKMPFTTTLFVLSLMIGSSVCAFRITSVSPASRNGTTEMDGTFSLTCIASASIRSCVWRHKDKACKLAYSATSGGLVKSRCKVYESKIFVVGDYKRHECAIQVQSASAYDSGMWKCEVREYVTRWNLFASPKTVTSSFHVKVMNKTHVNRKPGSDDDLLDSRGDFGTLDKIPISGSSAFEGGDETAEEAAEAQLALNVVSSLFGLILVVVIVAAAFVAARKSGIIKRMTRRGSSLRLEEFVGDDDCRMEEASPRPDVPEEGYEKALSKLGVLTYAGSRRVI